MKKQARNILAVGLVMAGIVSVLAIYHLLRNRWPQGIQTRTAELRVSGLPVNLQELDEFYASVPPDENAAVIYEKAFEALTWEGLPSRFEGKSIVFNGPLSRLELHELEQFLEQNRAALALLQEARAFNQSRFPVELRFGYETEMPHLPKAREAAKMLALAAICQAELGNSEQAARAVLASLHLARLLDLEPSMISHLFRNAVLAWTNESLEWVLNRCVLQDEDLGAIQAAWIGSVDLEGFYRALHAERATGLALFMGDNQQLQKFLEAGGITGWVSVEVLRVTGGLRRDCAYFLNSFDELEADLRLPIWNWQEAIHLLNDKLEANSLSRTNPKQVNILSAMLLPIVGKFVDREIRNQVLLAVTELALTLEIYRRAHGELPASLHDLGGEYPLRVPLDPHTGEILQLALTGSGFVVSSSGPGMPNQEEPMEVHVSCITDLNAIDTDGMREN